ncbi:MAG: ornithine cyclodeaminase family protein [Nitrososphaerota archaeon]|nr:ornithine cyclodeaminase family protein [Nitrososphaerota archaeon]
MVILLTDEDSRQAIDMKTSISVIREAFAEHGKGKTASIPRSRMYVRSNERKEDFWLNVKAGGVQSIDFAAIRVDSGLKSLVDERVNLSRKSALVFLYSVSSGELLAIFHNDYLQKLRVGATTGVATDVLANKDIETVAILGSGRQARTNLEAVCMVRKPTTIHAFSPNRDHLRRFCLEMTERLGTEVIPCESPSEAVKRAEIVTVATNSKRPVFSLKDLPSSNIHINSILSSDKFVPGTDIDEAIYSRANIVVVNSRQQIEIDDQHPLKEMLNGGTGKSVIELGELVARNVVGRRNPEDFTLYDNNAGMGIQFAAICGHIYNEALQRGLGRMWPEELFDLNVYKTGRADIGKSYDILHPESYSSTLPNS